MSKPIKERPILMNGAMVRAVLEGRKTQTRRVLKMPRHMILEQRDDGTLWPWMFTDDDTQGNYWMPSPFGQTGDRLYVREAFREFEYPTISTKFDYRECAIWRGDADKYKWTPSIHMPRYASRITLEITNIRVERLNEISEADAITEGADWAACGSPQEGSHKAGFAALWESINGTGSWEANPWVWVVEFKVVQP